VSDAAGPRKLWDRLVGLAFGLFVISVAITLAVHLLESVWIEIVIGAVIAFALVLVYQIHQFRQSRW
jgi:CDP-diglyceride synthetase